MALALFFLLVLGLVALSAALGFLATVYVAKRSVLGDLVVDQEGAPTPVILLVLGLLLAVAIPIVGGAAYALSNAPWMTLFFGELGRIFWLWCSAAFAIGLVLALALPAQPRPTTTRNAGA